MDWRLGTQVKHRALACNRASKAKSSLRRNVLGKQELHRKSPLAKLAEHEVLNEDRVPTHDCAQHLDETLLELESVPRLHCTDFWCEAFGTEQDATLLFVQHEPQLVFLEQFLVSHEGTGG